MNELSMSDHCIEVWRVNAFTTTPFTGNPAGVVPDADGLSDRLRLANEHRFRNIIEFAGNGQHQSIRQSVSIRHNSGGVSRKGRGGKGIDSPHFYTMVTHR